MLLTAYLLFCLILTLAYAWLQLRYGHAWEQEPVWNIPPDFHPETFVSVVIAARNEAATIRHCLQAIAVDSYPPALLEILVADDFSEDDTARIVEETGNTLPVRVRLLRPTGVPDPATEGKKPAIARAVAEARGTLIVTTDADCIPPPDWLPLLVSLYQSCQPGAICAPVALTPAGSWLERFQALEFAGLMGITAGGLRMGWHRMGNGASLCYPRSVFKEVGGWGDTIKWASGDDMFLLQRIARKWPVRFLKNAGATVHTAPETTWTGFVQQRLRWGTKNTALPETGAKIILAVVFGLCTTLLINAVMGLYQPVLLGMAGFQIMLKAGTDYLFLRKMCLFFNRKELLSGFGWSACLHVLYIAGLGLLSLPTPDYSWKGRRVR